MGKQDKLIRRIQVFLVLSFLSLNSVGAQFYSDYGDGGGSYPYNSLHPFEIPVIYKQQVENIFNFSGILELNKFINCLTFIVVPCSIPRGASDLSSGVDETN
jgi:hypothetical protein